MGGSPARAGIDPVGYVEQDAWCRFPRTRGDRPVCNSPHSTQGMVPPHARG